MTAPTTLGLRPKPKERLAIPDWREDPRLATVLAAIKEARAVAPALDEALAAAATAAQTARERFDEAEYWRERESPDATAELVAELRAKHMAAHAALTTARAAAEKNAQTLARSQERLLPMGVEAREKVARQLLGLYADAATRTRAALLAAAEETEYLDKLWHAIAEQYPPDYQTYFEEALGCPAPTLVRELRRPEVDPIAGSNPLNVWLRRLAAWEGGR